MALQCCYFYLKLITRIMYPGTTMAKIIRLSEIKDTQFVKTGFKSWNRRFGDDFGLQTCLIDLKPHALVQLAEPGDTSCDLICDLIIGFMGYDEPPAFNALEMGIQVKVVDMHLFLADQVRFEIMVRLGWLTGFIARQLPLYRIVRDYEQIKMACRRQQPSLLDDHPLYDQYKDLFELDKQIFIRKLIPSALDAYKKIYSIT